MGGNDPARPCHTRCSSPRIWALSLEASTHEIKVGCRVRSPHRSFSLCGALLGRAVLHGGGGRSISIVSSLFERQRCHARHASVLVVSAAGESVASGVRAFARSCTPGEKGSKGVRTLLYSWRKKGSEKYSRFSQILFISCRLFAWEYSCHLGLRRVLRDFLGSFSGRVKAVITVRYLTQRRDN